MEGEEVADNLRNEKSIIISFLLFLIFSIIGIIMQSISKAELVLLEFFGKNYFSWFKLFEAFAYSRSYDSFSNAITLIVQEWYYFFVSVFFLAFLWALIFRIIHLVFSRKKKETSLSWTNKELSPEIEEIKKLDEWLEEGLKLLAEGNLIEAEMIYDSLRKEFNQEQIKDLDLKRRIFDFYNELLRVKSRAR